MTERSSPPILGEALAKAIDQHVTSVEAAYQGYAELRADFPVARSDRNGGYVILSRHADVRAAALDWKTFSSARGVGLPPDRTRPPLPALENDPPLHNEWRRRYTDAITPASLAAMAGVIEAIADELIDDFAGKGHCDLVSDFAEPLPVLGISAAIGLEGKKPEEIRQLALAMTATVADPVAQREALGRLGEFILGEIHQRRRDPRDDYLSKIAQMEVDGRLLGDGELSIFMIGFLVAGHETTTAALTGLLGHVLPRPELRHRLMTDDAALGAAIEEAVRLTSPFHGFSRTTTAPVEVAGKVIPADQVVRLCWASANRDPEVFPHPDTFDIDRVRNPHLGFGAGRHVCAGAPFARLEMRIALRRLFARLPDIAPIDERPDWHFVGGMMTLPDSLEAGFSPVPGSE